MPEPLLGPSGKPLPPSNPFMSSQGTSSTVSVNLDPAKQAFASLNTVLDKLTQQFGGNLTKASLDGMAAQERFWKYVGDKQKENEVAMRRYKAETIAGINAERDAELAALEVKKSAVNNYEQQKLAIMTKASEDAARVEREASRKMTQSKGIGGWVRGTRDAIIQSGGPIGSAVAGIGNLIANPEIGIPAAIFGAIIEMANKNAAFVSPGAQLRGAGLGRGGAATGLNFDQALFGGFTSTLSQALSTDQQRDIIAMMASSRTMIDQTRGGGMSAVRGNLGLFGNILPDATKEMEIFTDATKNLGMSQKDIQSAYFQSAKNAKDVRITQLDALSAQMEMAKALRNITNDGTVAASVLNNVGGFLKSLGTTSEGERLRLTAGIANAGANLSVSSMAGMLAFTQGLGPSSKGMEQALLGTNGVGGILGQNGTGDFGLIGSFISKVGAQFKNPMQRLFAAESLNQQLNLGLRTQDLPGMFNLADSLKNGSLSQKDFNTKIKEMSKDPNQLIKDGMDNIVNAVNPLTRIEHMFENFWRDADVFFDKHFGKSQNSNSYLHSEKNIHSGIPTAIDFRHKK